MDWAERLKRWNEQVSFTVLGNYAVEFKKLRSARTIFFIMTIFLINLNIFAYDQKTEIFFNEHIEWAIILLLATFLAILAVGKLYDRRTRRLRKKSAADLDHRRLLTSLAAYMLVMSLLSLLLVLAITVTASQILIHLLQSAAKEHLEIYLGNAALPYLLSLLSLLAVIHQGRRLFRLEKAERGFLTSELSINWLRNKLLKLAYLLTMVLSTVVEIGLVYQTYFVGTDTLQIGCIKGRVSLAKARRHLLAKGIDFQHLPITIDNPPYISLLNGTPAITFHVDRKRSLLLVNFGDYSTISHEEDDGLVGLAEHIIKRNGLISPKTTKTILTRRGRT